MTQVAGAESATLSDQAFQRIAKIAISDAGLLIPPSKKALVQSRLSRRMRALGLVSVDAYIDKVESAKDVAERRELISILTTNVSSFYREDHHFEHLRSHVFKRFEQKLLAHERVRIWSAGCSSGQEPYTIAMEIIKNLSLSARSDILVLGTDIDPAILERARKGVYSEAETSSINSDDRDRLFVRQGASFHACEKLRSLVRFRELNLHSTWPMAGPFDAIFCRNVLIYFDDAHQKALWPRFRSKLTPDGFLYLGHSERIHPLEKSGFISQGATIYQKAQ
ncbi:MAG: hypothetical protein HKN27_17620 [Silicimonas sp.]|nr:hypothetical protein [Silicimonas sp.]